jgi:hypothetical protein
MNNRINWRAVGFGLAVTASSLVVPTPAAATPEEYKACLHECVVAYYQETYQPEMYQQCVIICRQYDN